MQFIDCTKHFNADKILFQQLTPYIINLLTLPLFSEHHAKHKN